VQPNGDGRPQLADDDGPSVGHAPASSPVPWNSRDVWLGLAILVVLLILALLLAALAQRLISKPNFGLIVSLVELLLLAPVWWLTIRKYKVGWNALGLKGFDAGALGIGCGLLLLSYAFNLAYGFFLSLFGLSIQPDIVPLFAGLSSPWLLFIGGVVVAPLVEEIFFRGFVFAGLRNRYGWQKAALSSAALFGLIHFTPTAIIPIFLLGYVFAYLYQRSGSLWPGILMHASSNAVALGAAYVIANTNLGR
jgi:membrane protease YdiL (CAAX protease family)